MSHRVDGDRRTVHGQTDEDEKKKKAKRKREECLVSKPQYTLTVVVTTFENGTDIFTWACKLKTKSTKWNFVNFVKAKPNQAQH